MKKWNITIVLFGFFLLFSLIVFAILGFNSASLQAMIRYSARCSFIFFTMAFSSVELSKIFNQTSIKWLSHNRLYIGATFALIHFPHLVLLFIKNNLIESVFIRTSLTSLIGGVIAYTFIGLMLLSAFPFFSNRLSENKTKT